VESELFGHVKGAYTGALNHRDGRFKLADGGTIFLDEVGELPADTQVKLLRVLQEQEFEPIGSSKTVKVNVRIIAATNRDLSAAVSEGKFRSDLFYRLNVVPIRNPPLRERESDVPLLVSFFLQKFAKQFNKPTKQISDEMMQRLRRYPWPGNIRELQNVIERAVVLSPDGNLRLGHDLSPVPVLSSGSGNSRPPVPVPLPSVDATADRKPSPPPPPSSEGSSLEAVERQHIQNVLTQTNWIIEGQEGAAKRLNLNPSTLRSRMQKLGIKRGK
jgi:formate hydrogenlyase transcriptional activator